MYNVNIIQTGSSGNSIVIDDCIMIDCGLGRKTIGELMETKIEKVFVSHQHGDHINMAVLKHLLKVRPTLIRYGLYLNSETLAKVQNQAPAVAAEFNPEHLLKSDSVLTFKTSSGEQYFVETFKLYHDVENQGFVFTKMSTGETLLHATDTQSLKSAPDREYDYILVEGNWDERTLQNMLDSDDPAEQFRAVRNLRHMSVQAFERFARSHSKPTSVLVQLHESGDLGVTSELNGLNNDGQVSVEDKYVMHDEWVSS